MPRRRGRGSFTAIASVALLGALSMAGTTPVAADGGALAADAALDRALVAEGG
jgi:hypothetical protein